MAPDKWATVLLTVPTGSSDPARPLTTAEWAKFSGWLAARAIRPGQLLGESISPLFAEWTDARITPPRLQLLLGRSQAMEKYMARWQRAGLVVLVSGDKSYPRRLLQRLAPKAPPVLFATANIALLDQGGLAVVGSRRASADDCAYAAALGRRASEEGICIVSGGARGIDQSALRGSLEHGGSAVRSCSPTTLCRPCTLPAMPRLRGRRPAHSRYSIQSGCQLECRTRHGSQQAYLLPCGCRRGRCERRG